MTGNDQDGHEARLGRICLVLGALVAGAGLLVLAGMGVEAITHVKIVPSWAVVDPLVALTLIILLSLLLAFEKSDSERRRAERALVTSNRAMGIIGACNEVLVRATDEMSLLQRVCRIVIKAGGYETIWIRLFEPGSGNGNGTTVLCDVEDGFLSSPSGRWQLSSEGQAHVESAVRTRRPQLFDSPAPDEFFVESRSLHGRGPNSFTLLPIQSSAGVTGVFAVFASGLQEMPGHEAELLMRLAGDLEYGINLLRTRIANVRMQEELLRSNARLEGALERIQEAQKVLIQKERLSALSQMASGIAHDLNNALMPIVGFSDLLLSQHELLDDKEEVVSAFKQISEAARSARSITRRLRLIHKPEPGEECSSVNIEHVIKAALDVTRPRWETEKSAAGVSIKAVCKMGEAGPIWGVESELREALVNLIMNSIDAMPQGGVIEMATRSEADEVVVEVTDNGIGMTEEERMRCLEPFFTTKGMQGTGLGLPLVYGIVERHGGAVEIESEKGHGTTVRLHLPGIKSGMARVGNRGNGPVIQSWKIVPLKVLAVDDEKHARQLLEKFLKSDGHSVTLAADGNEAIKSLQNVFFDLVITDRAMPDISGDDVARAAKAHDRRTRVLLLTGFGDIMKDAGECPDGVDSILAKPITRAELRGAIASLMGMTG